LQIIKMKTEPLRVFAAARVAAELSVKELASVTGIGESLVRKIEAGADSAACEALVRYYAGHGIRIERLSETLTFAMSAGSDPTRRLVVARTAAGLTQSDLAALSGVSLRTISAIEKGNGNSTTANLDAITSALKRQGVVIQADPVSDGSWNVGPLKDRTPEMSEDYMKNLKPVTTNATFPDPDELPPRMEKLRIELAELDPPIWREISLPENATFSDLHAAIQIAFAWKDKYTHEFRCGVNIGNIQRDPEDPMFLPEMVDERTIRINQVSIHTEDFVYRYGKGEHWIATISRAVSEKKYSAHPMVTAGAGAHPPEEAWAEEWSELAHRLRTKNADEDALNWLQHLGFGRDYDPDDLNIEDVNHDLAMAGFDIPTTWNADFKRRRSLQDAGEQLLPNSYPRAPDKTRPPSGAFSVTKVESIGRNDVIADHKRGMTLMASEKAGHASVRHSHDGLVRILDLCSDVPKFETFPYSIHWTDDRRKGVFQPDFSILNDSGEATVVHVAYDEEEANFALSIAKDTSIKMKVVRADIVKDPLVETVLGLLSRAKLVWNNRDAGVADALRHTSGSIKPVAISQAVKILTLAGYGRAEHGFAFGTPEERAIACLSAAIANGSVGLDLGRSLVGEPHLTSDTCLFWPLLQRHEIRGARR
jgi:transcriptional regulator with XRE-family HTH domain